MKTSNISSTPSNGGGGSYQYQSQANLHHRAQAAAIVVSPLYIKDTLEHENSKLKHQINMLESQLGKGKSSGAMLSH